MAKFIFILKMQIIVTILLSFYVCMCKANDGDSQESVYSRSSVRKPQQLENTVLIALLVRNKAHALPFFLHYLQKLNYPKDRISIWIRCDHSKDNSAEILNAWIEHVDQLYHDIIVEIDNNPQNEFSDQEGDCHWSQERFNNVIKLRQTALNYARGAWADFVFFVDTDVMLLNENVLRDLIDQDKTVVAPMLNATSSEWYSNFWAGMADNGYYKRTPEYEPMLRRHWEGCFEVPNIHTAYLINLRHADSAKLAFYPPPPGYDGPIDDVIIFAHTALYHEIPLHVLNTDFYGYLSVPMQDQNTLEQEREQFAHMKVESIIYSDPLEHLPYIEIAPVPKDKLGFDQVYMINLLRRPDRRRNMLAVFDELGIETKIVDAVDGQMLNDSYLEKLGVKMLDGFADPYAGRPLTMGEIGCFLSHHYIWTDMKDNGYEQIAVFEDDLRFEPYFRTKLLRVMQQLEENEPQWDLVYLGRKRLNAPEESWLTSSLVYPHYSYWTLSYLLSRTGAEKLLNQNPLKKLIPVDEFLPVMFDRHPEDKWKEPFSPRDLVALSVQPLLIYPTHYTGEPGYITDTENSDVIDLEEQQHGGREESGSDTNEKNKWLENAGDDEYILQGPTVGKRGDVGVDKEEL